MNCCVFCYYYQGLCFGSNRKSAWNKGEHKANSPWPRYKVDKQLHYHPSSLVHHHTPLRPNTTHTLRAAAVVLSAFCALNATVCLLAVMLVLAWLSGFHEASNSDISLSIMYKSTHTMWITRTYRVCSVKCTIRLCISCTCLLNASYLGALRHVSICFLLSFSIYGLFSFMVCFC